MLSLRCEQAFGGAGGPGGGGEGGGGAGGGGDPPQQSSVQHIDIGAAALVPHPDPQELEWRAPLVQ